MSRARPSLALCHGSNRCGCETNRSDPLTYLSNSLPLPLSLQLQQGSPQRVSYLLGGFTMSQGVRRWRRWTAVVVVWRGSWWRDNLAQICCWMLNRRASAIPRRRRWPEMDHHVQAMVIALGRRLHKCPHKKKKEVTFFGLDPSTVVSKEEPSGFFFGCWCSSEGISAADGGSSRSRRWRHSHSSAERWRRMEAKEENEASFSAL